MQTTTTSLKEKIAEAEQTRQSFVSAHGEFLKFEQGVNTVQFLDEPVTEGRFGWNYQVILNGKRGILSLKGVLESRILTALAESTNNTVKVIRAGEGLDTRYAISV